MRYMVLACLVIGGCGASLSTSKRARPVDPVRQARVQEILNGINEARAAGNWASLEGRYRVGVREFPYYTRWKLGLAEALEKQNKQREALDYYELALSNHPGQFSTWAMDVEFLWKAGNCAESVGSAARAAEYYERVLDSSTDFFEGSPQIPKGFSSFAELKRKATVRQILSRGDTKQVLAELDRVILAAPNDPIALFYRGFYSQLARDFAGANEFYARAIRVQPDLQAQVEKAKSFDSGAFRDPLILEIGRDGRVNRVHG